MTMSEAIYTVLWKKYWSFSGRASRSEYWLHYLFYVLAGLVFPWIILVLAISYHDEHLLIFTKFFFILFFIYNFIPNISVSARRLHDTGLSAWNLLWLLLPIIGQIGLIIVFLFPGEKKENKYGLMSI